MARLYEKAAYDERGDGSNFWRTTVAGAPCPALDRQVRADVVVLGAGLTGLNAALELVETDGASVVVLDAAQPGYGASGRAGGFCCLGGAALDGATIERQHGRAEAERWFASELAAVTTVRDALDRYGIDADTHSDGETLLAHSAKALRSIEKKAARVHADYGVQPVLHNGSELAGIGLDAEGFHGAMTVPVGFALNPLKYTLGLLRAAKAAGVEVFGQSPATGLRRAEGGWRVDTPKGQVMAGKVIVAANGYLNEDLHSGLAARLLPVMSSIIVTEPLSPELRAAQGWTSSQMCYDSRNLLHYFRLMPDGRMLFGQRGAVRASERAFARTRARTLADFRAMFPAWSVVPVPHFWSGLVAFSKRLTPFVGEVPDAPGAYAALAFHGNGIAMGSFAGRSVAAACSGRATQTPLPDFTALPLKRFHLGPFRRMGLRIAVPLARLADRWS